MRPESVKPGGFKCDIEQYLYFFHGSFWKMEIHYDKTISCIRSVFISDIDQQKIQPSNCQNYEVFDIYLKRFAVRFVATSEYQNY